MAKDIKILSFKGISVKLHWSFIVFVLWLGLTNPGDLGDKLAELGFIVAIFSCVVCHEYGHALTARSFGIKTRDITLYPIGGVAVLEREPKPVQEFFIALAGPLVNVVIAGCLSQFYSIEKLASLDLGSDFGARLLIANLVLVLFNMIPAYPMDGGRVLRAGLGIFLDRGRATVVSGRIGQFFCILLAGAALYFGHIMLLMISLFIFVQAQKEISFWRRRAEHIRLYQAQNFGDSRD